MCSSEPRNTTTTGSDPPSATAMVRGRAAGMTAVLRILFVIPLAFLAACLAAGAFLVLALAGGAEGWREAAAYDEQGMLVVLGGAAALIVAAVVAIPAFVVIILAELFGWRSVFFYLIAGVLIGLAVGLLPAEQMDPQGDNAGALLAAVGAVGGFVYWLIAGRSAGFTGAEPPGPPGQPGP